MTTTIEAVYEGGVFRPVYQLALTEGTHVEVIIPVEATSPDPKTVAAKLARIAAHTPRTGQSESTSLEHDQILYGSRTPP